MHQRRGCNQPKQDHSVYVQQLFRDFLTRNNEIPITAARTDARTNFSRAKPGVAEQRKQPGIFDRAVYARFERNTNSGSFIRQAPTNRSKTGLMRWIDQQRNNRPRRNVAQKVSRLDGYLNLPGNFFSNTEHMKLPFEVADKTIGNVTNNFVPPATSTPFDRMASFGVSGVLSDPEEIQSNPPAIQPTSCTNSSDWDMFLKNCEDYLTGVTDAHECASEWIHQRNEMETLLKTREKDEPVDQKDRLEIRIENVHVMASKHNDIVVDQIGSSRVNSPIIYHNHSRNSRTCDLMSLETPMEMSHPFPVFLDEPMPDQDPILTKHKKRNNVTFLIEPTSQSKIKSCSRPTPRESSKVNDILLTASPPSPNMSSSRTRCLYEESTFLLDRMPSDDTLMEKLDALLEEEEFTIHGENTAPDMDFCTPANHPTMNISFPSQLQVLNNHADDSILANAGFADTPLYLSQDLMMAPTIQDFREALF